VAWLQREHQIREFVDGNGNAAVGLKLHNKPSSGDLNRQFPIGNCTELDHFVMLCFVEMSLVFMALYTGFFFLHFRDSADTVSRFFTSRWIAQFTCWFCFLMQ